MENKLKVEHLEKKADVFAKSDSHFQGWGSREKEGGRRLTFSVLASKRRVIPLAACQKEAKGKEGQGGGGENGQVQESITAILSDEY